MKFPTLEINIKWSVSNSVLNIFSHQNDYIYWSQTAFIFLKFKVIVLFLLGFMLTIFNSLLISLMLAIAIAILFYINSFYFTSHTGLSKRSIKFPKNLFSVSVNVAILYISSLRLWVRSLMMLLSSPCCWFIFSRRIWGYFGFIVVTGS